MDWGHAALGVALVAAVAIRLRARRRRRMELTVVFKREGDDETGRPP